MTEASFSILRNLRKTITLVDRSTLYQAVGVIFIILLTVALEALSLGLLFPLVQALINPEKSAELFDIGVYLPFDGNLQSENIIIFLTVLIFIVFIIKNLCLLALYYIQARYAMNNMKALSLRVYRMYLHMPYKIHQMRNSAGLIHNVHAASTVAIGGSLIGYLSLATELVMVISIAMVLVFFDPVPTLGALGFLIIGVLAFLKLLNYRVRYWGERAMKIDKTILGGLQQGLHSIKEIIILGRANYILNRYEYTLREYVWLTAIKQIMANLPRLWIETLSVAAIAGIVTFSFLVRGSALAALPILTIFLAASFRLVPSVNRMIVSLNSINNASFTVNTIYDDLMTYETLIETDTEIETKRMPFNRELIIDKVNFRYEGAEIDALKEISLTLKKGESLGVVGPSGAGKSTLIDIILGIMPTAEGRVLVDGTDISDSYRTWQNSIGYVPQHTYLIDDTLGRNIAFGIDDENFNQKAIKKAIKLANLEEFITSLPDGLDTNIYEHGVRLSGGQRQRVAIARALYHDPDVLIFDEATSALDSVTEQEINHAIQSLSMQKTVIIIAHRLSTIRKCDKIVLLSKGKVAGLGTFDELVRDNKQFEELAQLSNL
jgi:ABC-type multidrug transport system fused ATPase/permease subunit